MRVLIIGGSIGGLAAAIAFARSGHQVILLEERQEIGLSIDAGTRLGPNVTKILYGWGYEEKLKEVGITSPRMGARHLNTGEMYGWHIWEEELIRDAEGDYTFLSHNTFLRFLNSIAVELHVDLRYGTKVVSVNVKGKCITLEDGKVLTGDVIVGADGEFGLTRTMFEPEEDHEPEHIANAYCTTVPVDAIKGDPLTEWLLRHDGQITVWFGDGKSVLAWPTGGAQYAVFGYGPPDFPPTGWEGATKGTKDKLMDLFSDGEPLLRRLFSMARAPQVIKVTKGSPLQDWWHPEGPLALVGGAAQPIVAGALREASISFEDGVTLGYIFRYLRSAEQIPDLLGGYEDLRRDRDILAQENEIHELGFETLAYSMSADRDNALRAKRDLGQNIFGLKDDGSLDVPEWRNIMDQFAFHAEHAVEDWWQKNGRLIDRGKSVVFMDGPALHITMQKSTQDTYCAF